MFHAQTLPEHILNSMCSHDGVVRILPLGWGLTFLIRALSSLDGKVDAVEGQGSRLNQLFIGNPMIAQ